MDQKLALIAATLAVLVLLLPVLLVRRARAKERQREQQSAWEREQTEWQEISSDRLQR